MESSSRAPRVSVVVPTLNAEAFLVEAVDSVRSQTYRDWELLLVDDGSTDASAAIARRYATLDPSRIRCLSHPGRDNRGASATRNLGIAHSRGEYLALLDADDVWLPAKLAEQVALLDAQPRAGAVIGPAFWWYGWTGDAADLALDRVDPVGFAPGTVIEPPLLLISMLLEAAPVPLPSAMLLRKATVDGVGGFEDSFRTVFTDQAFFTKLFLVTPVLAADRIWVRYRRHPGSSVARLAGAGGLDAAARTYLDWASEYLAAQGARGTPLWRALQRRRWRQRNPRLARLLGRAKYALRAAIRPTERGPR